MLRFVILLILMLNFVSPLSFGIDPARINLELKTNEFKCTIIKLSGDNLIFNGDIVWSEENNEIVNNYNIKSEDLSLEVNFPKRIPSGDYEICFMGKTRGKYYGALRYKIENSSYGIISWIVLDIKEESIQTTLKDKINLISRNVRENRTNFSLTGILTLLISIFLLILFTKRK